MSWKVSLQAIIKDMDTFATVCEENGVNFDMNTLKMFKNGRYLGCLEEDKKDGVPTGEGMILVTDSDFTKRNSTQNMNTLMQNYSERVVYMRLMGKGTIMERTEEDDGSILLKVAVNQ